MIKNKRGVTLLELLLALALSGIVTLIICGVFFQGIRFSNIIREKTSLQQEANRVITELTRLHQTTVTPYTVSCNASSCTVTSEDGKEIAIDNRNYIYTLSIADREFLPVTIDPEKQDLTITVTITDKEDPSLQYEISTVLAKINN
ncbi:prepilin-type N-terminal cleavage/methylation domain-containing protein [Bacillaceae bacterium Marseille-Q3522]|nr:prepilin-type N-terminal cleavage/methylation domain-containing protein [Bacillaceae bacterium Marseille-Q3522]